MALWGDQVPDGSSAVRLLRRSAQTLGLPGRVGLCLCVLALWVWLCLLPTQREQAQELEAHNHWLQQRLAGMSSGEAPGASASGPAADPEQSAQARWAQVWRSLPDASQASRHQEALWRAAPGLTAEPVTLVMEPVSDLPGLSRWRLSVNTVAPWPQQWRWLQHVLADPAVSIDALSLQRDQPHDALWHLRLGVSLWTRDATPASAGARPVQVPQTQRQVTARQETS
jgi:hypothetical protein